MAASGSPAGFGRAAASGKRCGRGPREAGRRGGTAAAGCQRRTQGSSFIPLLLLQLRSLEGCSATKLALSSVEQSWPAEDCPPPPPPSAACRPLRVATGLPNPNAEPFPTRPLPQEVLTPVHPPKQSFRSRLLPPRPGSLASRGLGTAMSGAWGGPAAAAQEGAGAAVKEEPALEGTGGGTANSAKYETLRGLPFDAGKQSSRQLVSWLAGRAGSRSKHCSMSARPPPPAAPP